MSIHCLLSHFLYDMEKLTVPGSSSLKTKYKDLCLKDKKNPLHLPKEKANFSKINGGRVTFPCRI